MNVFFGGFIFEILTLLRNERRNAMCCWISFHQSSCMPSEFSLTSSLFVCTKPFAACELAELVVFFALAGGLLLFADFAGIAATGTDDT